MSHFAPGPQKLPGAVKDLADASDALSPVGTENIYDGRGKATSYSVPKNPDVPKARKELAEAAGRLDYRGSPNGRIAYNLLIRLDPPNPDVAGVFADLKPLINSVVNEPRKDRNFGFVDLTVEGAKTLAVAGVATGTIYMADRQIQKAVRKKKERPSRRQHR